MRIKIANIAGMNGYIDPAKLSESEFALLENYTLKSYGNVGSLVSRPGIQRYGDTQIASGGTGVGSGFEATLNGTDYMITNIINGGSSGLYYKQSPYTTGGWTAITGANGSAQGYKLNYASFKDKVYIANRTAGTATNTVWDGTTAGFYDMGCPPCDNVGITATPETVGALSYSYWVTFLYDDSQESGALQSSNLAGVSAVNSAAISTSSGITLAVIPVSTNPRCTARKIYRTKVGESAICYFVGILRDNVSTSYLDRQPDSNLADGIDPVYLTLTKKPFISKYNIQNKERIWQAYLRDNEYTVLADTTDVAFTTSDTGGGLGSGVYKYKVFKGWLVNSGGYTSFRAGRVLDKTVDLSAYTGTDNRVILTFQSTITSDPWYNFVFILRTKVGGSTYFGYSVYASGTFPKSAAVFTDSTADSSLVTPLITIPDIGNPNTSYTGNLVVSDAGKPDLFSNVETAPDGTLTSASNEWNIGEPITGIHSEENRIVIFANNNIHELDTRSQSRIFWNTNKIVSGIGADDGLQVQCGNKYVFVKTSQITKNKITVYEWDGRNEPEPCELAIRKYIADLNGTGAVTIKDLRYDQLNSQVHIIAQYTDDLLVSRTIIFIYNLDIRDSLGLGKWEIWLNATNLNLNIGIQTKNYGLLYGGGDGYIQYPLVTSYRDVIAGSGALFTTKLRTKTFETFDSDLMIKNFRADITSTGAITPSLKTAVDGTLNSGDNMPALASGFNRPRLTGFTNAQGKSFRQVYFQLEMSANEQYKVHGLTIDFDESAGDAGGR